MSNLCAIIYSFLCVFVVCVYTAKTASENTIVLATSVESTSVTLTPNPIPNSEHQLKSDILQCFTCYTDEYGIEVFEQSCDPYKIDSEPCIFTNMLLNWDDMQEKKDYEVNFTCVLFKYKNTEKQMEGFAGCGAVYEDYKICERIERLKNLKHKNVVNCTTCNTNRCNYEQIMNSRNFSTLTQNSYITHLLVLFVYSLIFMK